MAANGERCRRQFFSAADSSASLAALARHGLTILDLAGYCENMKNITVSVDDETYRRARMKAAEQDTSVSALVKAFLADLAEDESDTDRLRREERALRAQIKTFRAADRLPRDQMHQRGSEGSEGSEI
jgi:uncharacterized protein YdaU (DUF1376 family)